MQVKNLLSFCSALAFLAFGIGCQQGKNVEGAKSLSLQASDEPSTGAQETANHIAELLSTKCGDGYHFAEDPDMPPTKDRIVRVESRGSIDGEDKFLGYGWRGTVVIGPPGNGYGTGSYDERLTSYNLFEQGDTWYIETQHHAAPTRVHDCAPSLPCAINNKNKWTVV